MSDDGKQNPEAPDLSRLEMSESTPSDIAEAAMRTEAEGSRRTHRLAWFIGCAGVVLLLAGTVGDVHVELGTFKLTTSLPGVALFAGAIYLALKGRPDIHIGGNQ